ncbi:hypothetical protein Taro_038214 [Colocasia esculenta]|uniref:Uncharacterized protein n=1 Tax=Colocasia esculenta TaxID=4460 RepID=A0A843WC54_COLES|nr:hypothetical protein [Colocasia esculenta]
MMVGSPQLATRKTLCPMVNYKLVEMVESWMRTPMEGTWKGPHCLLGGPIVLVVFISDKLVGAIDWVMAYHIRGSLVPSLPTRVVKDSVLLVEQMAQLRLGPLFRKSADTK